jgi:benzoyl-CoA reductase/2-hydroxyglutaryl-CoA dehydratase subunit BcrC/BadD/HgdB
MSTSVQVITGRLAEAAASPAKTVSESCSRTGKKAVGWAEPYAPEEIIHAAGCLPVGLWGGRTRLRSASTVLQPFACSIMQSITELSMNGVYDDLAAVIFSSPCDTLKCIGQKWRGKCPAIQFAHPMNRRLDCAGAFLVSEYESIRGKLRDILGVEISDASLAKSVALYNDWRGAMRAFTKVAAAHLDVITPTVRHAVMKSAMFMDKAEHLALVKELTAALSQLETKPWPGKKVVITGISFEPDELTGILEDCGIAVVADDLAQESRQFRTDAPPCADPMTSLAKQWQAHEGCSLAFDPYKNRIGMILDMVKEYGADGVILGLMQFCDPEEYDVPMIKDACEKAGVAFLLLDIDQQSAGFEQARTRLESFADLL